jgi:hypothetical protein
MASFRPLAFELEAKEICPHPASLLPPPAISKNFCLIQQFCPFTTVCFGFQLWTCMHCISHFKGQKWNRVIYLFWNDATLLFTYSTSKIFVRWNFVFQAQAFGFFKEEKLSSLLQNTGSVDAEFLNK